MLCIIQIVLCPALKAFPNRVWEREKSIGIQTFRFGSVSRSQILFGNACFDALHHTNCTLPRVEGIPKQSLGTRKKKGRWRVPTGFPRRRVGTRINFLVPKFYLGMPALMLCIIQIFLVPKFYLGMPALMLCIIQIVFCVVKLKAFLHIV